MFSPVVLRLLRPQLKEGWLNMFQVGKLAKGRLADEIPRIGQFVMHHSWGEDFPLDAGLFLAHADSVIAAYRTAAVPELVGCACITRYRGCPDYPDDVQPWFCCWLVHPDYRYRGIGRRLYDAAIEEMRLTKRPGDHALYASTDSDAAAEMLTTRPRWPRWHWRKDGVWVHVRDGKNEDGSPMKVWYLHL